MLFAIPDLHCTVYSYSMSPNRDEVKLKSICEKTGGVAEVLKYNMSGMRATSEI